MAEGGTVQRVGVLGGTFDPLHHGHLAVASFVRERLRLAEFLFIPAARPPHKSHDALTPFADRLSMLRLALAGASEFQVSDLEAGRHGPSYSVDTLVELRRQYGPERWLVFVIGLDAFLEVDSWKDFRRLPHLADLVVINRVAYPLADLTGVIDKLGDFRPDPGGQSWRASDAPGRIDLLAMPPVEISSTMVRQAVAAGAPLTALVPAPVADYIRQHRLYSLPAQHHPL